MGGSSTHKTSMCAHGYMLKWGGGLLGDLLPSGQLGFFQIHAYSDYYQRASHQFSTFFLA